MNIYFNQVKDHDEVSFESSLNKFFKEDALLKKINNCKGTITLNKAENTLIINFNILCNINITSSYTGVPFNKEIKIDDTLYFTNTKSLDSDDIIFVKDLIDLDYYVYSLLITSIPVDAHKDGEKLPKGKDYRVLTEDEYLKEKASSGSNAFSALNDIDFGD